MTEKELPNGWVLTKLSDVCFEPQYGWTSSAIKNGNIHLLRTTDITTGKVEWRTVPYCKIEPKDINKYLLRDGDIVISRAGSVGYSLLIKNPKKAIFASYLIRFKTLIDEHYFLFYLKSPFYWQAIQEKKLGIAIPNVNATKLKNIDLHLPPLPEQHRIVAKIEELFSDLDAGIGSLKKARAQLKIFRQAVLKYAFEGKLTQEWRKQNAHTLEPTEQLLKKIKDEREKQYDTQLEEWQKKVKEWENGGKKGMKPAKPKQPKELPPLTEDQLRELPELPKGWSWVKLAQISNAFGGFAFKSKYFDDSGRYQVLKIANVKMGHFSLNSRPSFVNSVTLEIFHKYGLKDGDCVITLTGTRKKRDYGFVAMVKGQKNLLLNQRLAAIRFIPPIYPEYYQYSLRGHHFQNNFFKYETGNVGQGNVGMKAISEETIALPPIQEQHQTVLEIESRLSVCDKLEQTIDESLKKAESLRQSILKKAFEGKLVPQWPDLPAPQPGKYWVYVIKCENNTNYIGQTINLRQRWSEHLSGDAADWTKRYPPLYVMYWEECDSRVQAVKREKELKSGFGRKWLKREESAGRLWRAGEPAHLLLERIKKEKEKRELQEKENQKNKRNYFKEKKDKS